MKLSTQNVTAWAASARAGERMVYARRPLGTLDSARPRAAMSAALAAHQEGLVFLAQRRAGSMVLYEAARISDEAAKALKLGRHA